MKKNILVIGSSLKDKGGIVTVMNNIYDLIGEKYNFSHIETYITTNNIFKKFLFFIKGIILMIYKLLFSSIDLIHIHMSYKGSFYRKSIVIFIVKFFNVPIVAHIHGSTFKDYYDNASFIEKKLIRNTLDKVDSLVVLSQGWASFFSGLIEDSEKIEVVYNGVKPPKQIPSKKINKNPKFLFLGRLGERKGIYVLLDSLKKYKEAGYFGHAYIAGDGEIEKVKKVINDYNLNEMITVVGWIDSYEKEKLLNECDVLILPSFNEGLPMSLLEGMSYGMGIISTRVGGIPELVTEDENGLLVQEGNADELFHALSLMHENYAWRQELVSINYNKIKQSFNLEILISDIEKIYGKLIKKRGVDFE
ncbi:glycosyltransferase family 4 protein [Halobacillus sp. Cin3]|uniref:glycosyltransferase family 4 protein n=1 Tax=Halobacillus sp. Cin3 TaxID=2928441 RepID=UPI00248E53BC|nr:glycosyltransferase family 4 protein [Halobacillus sp. Cin3]